MNTIFTFLNYTILYERCVMASVAHAIMVGKYNLLAAEQSWDGLNYNFQNMEGIRGVVSFAQDRYVCVIQNNTLEKRYKENCAIEILCGAEERIINLAKEEALQYMLINHKGKTFPFISAAFWGNENTNYSNFAENEIISISERTIMPFLYAEKDVNMYWKDYYDMTDEQVNLAEDIYRRRISESGKINLRESEINKLKKWFGNIDECIESFQELNIYVD